MSSEIREVSIVDESAWRGLWAQYLDFYGVVLAPVVTDQTWARLVDPAAVLRGRLVLVEGAAVGFALHHTHLSTWSDGPDCYLEDL
ncbi:MAG: GNAT family N-acetyltransferase, partial [Pseudorhodobacter sp.]|nr:GNAT family N-acetyltransferase [Pseudorhodobacter sp.]